MAISNALDSAGSVHRLVRETFLATTYKSGITFLVCDDRGRARVVAPVDEAPASPSLEECRVIASAFASVAGEQRGGLLLLIERAGPERVVESDRLWLLAMREACAKHGARMLGVWSVMPGLAREVTLDDLADRT